jgi:S1-C subfamily serine protease
MMRLLASALIWMLPAGLAALDDTALIQNGKRATALVINESLQGSGSAFCIHSSGVFVTNAHVVRGIAANGTVKLFLNCGEKDEREYSARILRAGTLEGNGGNDLAVLQVENAGPAKFPSLELGDADALIETAVLTAFGYPFGEALATDKSRRPNITVSTGRVTSLRKDSGKLALIQLDASVNPGNSGGPVLDKSGKVVGVIVSGVPGAAINFAIPSGHLKPFIQEPLVVFAPPPVAAKDRANPVTLTVKVVDILPAEGPTTVEIQVGEGAAQRSLTASESSPGTFSAQVVPVPEKPKSASQVEVTLEFKKGQMTGFLEDQSLSLGGTPVKLSEIHTVDVAAKKLTLSSGEVKDGFVLTLARPEMDLGGMILKIDPTKIERLTVSPPVQAANSDLPCKAIVRRKSKVVKEAAATLRIEAPEDARATARHNGPEAAGAGAPPVSIRPPEDLGEEPTERPLPGIIDDVVVAGNGRYLLLLMRNIKKIGVLDVTTGKADRYITIPGDNVMAAAGAEKLLLVNADQNIVQRLKLASGEKEFTGKLPVTGVVKAVVMGHNSKNTMLVHWAVGTDALAQGKYDLINIETMRSIELEKFQARNGISYRDTVHLRASADGNTYGLWCTSHSPSGLESLILVGKKVSDYYEHNSVGHVIPSADGKYILTGSGIYTSQLKKRGADRLNIFAIPSTAPNWHLGINVPLYNSGDPKQKRRVDVYVLGQDTPLLGINAPEMAGGENDAWARTDFTQDKRYWFIPSAELLVTIPNTNDRLVLRRVNILQQLEKQGVDYLFVVSSPPTSAAKGRRYEYQLEVKAKRAISKYSVDGPPGMTISPTGRISWSVPAGADRENAVVVTIKDATGQEVFHTFNLSVE